MTTNLELYSQQLDNGYWDFTSYGTVTADAGAAPDGTTTADQIGDSGGYAQVGHNTAAISLDGSSTYTYSFCFKRVTSGRQPYLQLNDYTSGTQASVQYFNLDTVAGGGTETLVGSAIGFSGASVTSLGSGWYRCSVSFPSSAYSAIHAFIGICDTVGNRSSSSGSGLFWGMQCEVGSGFTSYVPTTSAPATSGVAGSLTATEQADTPTAAGVLKIAAAAGLSEAGDAAAAAGSLLLTAVVAGVEAADTAVAGAVLRIAVAAAIVEDGDTAAATGALRVAGTALLTEQPDTLAATGAGSQQAVSTGTLAATEAADGLAASVSSVLQAGLAASENADTITATGTIALRAAMSAMEQADGIVAAGLLALQAQAAWTETGDVVSASAVTSGGAGLISAALVALEASDTLLSRAALAQVRLTSDPRYRFAGSARPRVFRAGGG